MHMQVYALTHAHKRTHTFVHIHTGTHAHKEERRNEKYGERLKELRRKI